MVAFFDKTIYMPPHGGAAQAGIDCVRLLREIYAPAMDLGGRRETAAREWRS